MGVESFDNLFGIRLRFLMSEHKVSQSVLAEEFKITRQSISGYLIGHTLPNIEKLYQIARYFNVSADYLIGIHKRSDDEMGVEKFDFREAHLRWNAGQKLIREGWNGKGFWVQKFVPTPSSEITRPFLCHVSPKGTTGHYGNSYKEFECVPWLPSQSDLFANDWIVID